MGDNSTLNNKMNIIYIRKFCKATFISSEFIYENSVSSQFISREYDKIYVQNKR